MGRRGDGENESSKKGLLIEIKRAPRAGSRSKRDNPACGWTLPIEIVQITANTPLLDSHF